MNTSHTYLKFEDMCRNGTCDEIEKFISMNNIDINYDDNFYIELLIERGDINLLKLIEKNNGNLHYDNETVMNILGLYGYIDCLEYMVNKCKNNEWKILLKTNAYNNNMNTKIFMDQKLQQCSLIC